jgi:zinc protease
MTAPIEVGGAPVFVEPAPAIPLVTAIVAVRGGAAADPIDLSGRAHHIAELAVRGAGDRDRAAIDEALDQLGTQLAVTTNRDSFSYSATFLARNLEPVCALLAEVLARPRFDAAEHRKLARETLADLDELRDDDFEIAARCFDDHYAPGHPYGRPIEGDVETVEALAGVEAAALAAAYREQVCAPNLVLGFAGAIDAATAERSAARLLEPLAGQAPPAPRLDDPPLAARPRLILVDKPERSQSQILLGHRGPRFGTVDATAMALVETAFGGMFTSRLMREIRVKRGWSYGAGMRVAKARGSHWMRMSLAPSAEVTASAIELVIELYRDLAARGLEADEIELARLFVVGSTALSRATARHRVHAAVTARTFGVADDYVERYAERIAAIGVDEVAGAIERHVHPDSLTIAVVATADRLAAELERLDIAEVEVVGY